MRPKLTARPRFSRRSLPFVIGTMCIAACSQTAGPAAVGAPSGTTSVETAVTPSTSLPEEAKPATTTTRPPRTTTTSTIPAPTDVYVEPTIEGVNLDACRLRDQSGDLDYPYRLSTGFPVVTTNFGPEGTFKIALVPIDFNDVPGTPTPVERLQHHMDMTSDWYSMVSDGRVTIEWQPYDGWIRINDDLEKYALDRSRSDDDRIARLGFAAADPLIDFTDVKGVAFFLPEGQTLMAEGVQGFRHSEFGGSGGYTTGEGTIYNYMLGGSYWERPDKELWSYWAHEMGHMFPLPDLYDNRTQWWNGVQLEIPGGPFSQFDMMASQDGPSRTLSTWLRFLMGWLDDSQVLCLDPAGDITGDLSLVHTDSDEPGLKSVMIPLDEQRLIVVEARRPNTTFDCPTSTKPAPGWRVRNGVLVFTADMTIGHGNAFQQLIAPEGRGLNDVPDCGVPRQFDAILAPGDSVTVEGITISVRHNGNYDHISIARSS